MATHSSVLAWRIPGTVGPGGLPSMGLQSRTRLKRLSSSSSSVYLLILQFLIHFSIFPLVIIMFVFYNTLIFKNYFKNCGKGASLVVQMVKNPPAMQETQVGSLGPISYGNLIFSMLRKSHTIFYSSCTILYSHLHKSSSFPTSLAACIFCFLTVAMVMGVRWYVTVALICISLVISDARHLLMCLLAICFSLLFGERNLFKSYPHF